MACRATRDGITLDQRESTGISSVKPVSIVALVGIVALGAWLWPDGEADRSNVATGPSDALVPAGSIEAADPFTNADAPNLPVPGSMAAELLNTTEANRIQMLTLAISDARYECPPGASVRPAGTNGAVWRVHCGESNIYWVEVSAFGRLLVTPAPYGDFIGGSGDPRREFESDRPLEQRNQIELEERLRDQLE